MEKKIFYRVSNFHNQQGLWYDYEGNFTGLIHTKFKFCMNNELEMPYNESIVGWLSSTDKLNEIFNWFSKEDISKLEEFGYGLAVYEATEYREYENHWLIKQDSSEFKLYLPVDSL